MTGGVETAQVKLDHASAIMSQDFTGVKGVGEEEEETRGGPVQYASIYLYFTLVEDKFQKHSGA